MRAIPALAVLLALAAPAAAQPTVKHQLEGRFGVAYSDAGDARTRAVAGAEYTMSVHHPFDNGWALGLGISVDAGNFERRGPRYHPDPHPGLRFSAPGS
ncbi:hypothetical protein [Pararhodobacter sp. SW119]|uniref:hypothetical protein n=1 Tax=Pararhodobacter sp. SW119 TaxID=2780075 RepID=UPI001ADF6BD1|nr:hypothetical protein [Pararhodobacter sp. SW119]